MKEEEKKAKKEDVYENMKSEGNILIWENNWKYEVKLSAMMKYWSWNMKEAIYFDNNR